MPYFTLVSRPKVQSGEADRKWGIEFGDKIKSVVAVEGRDMADANKLEDIRREYKIVTSKTASQKSVNEAVAELQAKG